MDRDKVEANLNQLKNFLTDSRVPVLKATINLIYHILQFIYGYNALQRLQASLIIATTVSLGILAALYLSFYDPTTLSKLNEIEKNTDPWLYEIATNEKNKEVYLKAQKITTKIVDPIRGVVHLDFIHNDPLSKKIRKHNNIYYVKLTENILKDKDNTKLGTMLLFKGYTLDSGFNHSSFISLIIFNLLMDFAVASIMIVTLRSLIMNHNLIKVCIYIIVNIIAFFLLLFININLYLLFFFGFNRIFLTTLSFIILMLVSIFLAGTGLSGIYNIIKHLPQFYDTFKDDFLYSYFSRWYDKIVITMTIISFFALCLSLFILPCLIFIYYYDYLFLIYRESYSIYNEIITIDYIANNILNHRLTANFAAYLLSGTLLIPIILFILIMIMVTIIKLSTESIRETVAGFLNGITGDGTSNTTAFITLLTFISSIVVTILFPTDASNSNAIDDKKGIQVETVKRDSI